MADHPITLWTIRLSLLCYATVLASRLARRPSAPWNNTERGIWTFGSALILAHLASAFHFHHGWSHAHAVAETARQTRELIGREFGGGVFFNYLFAAIWTADAAWMWFGRASFSRRPVWLAAIIHTFLLFIVINGAVVFATGPTRWISVVVGVGLAGLMLRTRSATSLAQSASSKD